MRSLVDMFLGGILCGVVLAAAVTFAVAIPANNTHWQVEIVKRGGGDWYFDKNGKITWMWTVKPNGVPVHATIIVLRSIVPQSQRISDSSREQL